MAKVTAKNVSDEIAAEIKGLAEGIRKLLGGKLNERALIVLIHDAIPQGVANKGEIKEILHAVSDLDRHFLKREKAVPYTTEPED